MFSKPNKELLQILSSELNLPLAISELLINRCISSSSECEIFFKVNYEELKDEIKNLEKTAKLLTALIKKNEQLLIYADCTVSGFLNGLILFSYLKQIGTNAKLVMPNRKKDGYGIQLFVLKKTVTPYTKLIIFISCHFDSINDYKKVKQKYNIDYLFLHQHARENLDIFELELNSDSEHSNTIKMFRLLEVIDQELKLNQLEKVIDLIALTLQTNSTLMLGIVRYIVQHVKLYANSKTSPFLKQLEKRLFQTGSENSFIISAMINSNLILGENELLISSFLSTNNNEITATIENLIKNHQTRLNTVFKKYKQIEMNQFEVEEKDVIFYQIDEAELDQLNFIAMKLSQKFLKPSLVYKKLDDGIRGSAYSNHVIDLKSYFKELKIESVKGHKNSLSFKISEIELKLLKQNISNLIQKNKQKPLYETILDLDEIDSRFVRLINLFEPFGEGNPKPVFLAKDLVIVGMVQKLKQKHLKFQVKQRKNIHDAIAFNMSDDYDWVLSKRSNISFRFQLNETFWAGKKSLQLIIKGFDSN